METHTHIVRWDEKKNISKQCCSWVLSFGTLSFFNSSLIHCKSSAPVWKSVLLHVVFLSICLNNPRPFWSFIVFLHFHCALIINIINIDIKCVFACQSMYMQKWTLKLCSSLISICDYSNLIFFWTLCKVLSKSNWAPETCLYRKSI